MPQKTRHNYKAHIEAIIYMVYDSSMSYLRKILVTGEYNEKGDNSMKCSNCNAELNEDAMFCENCGAKIEPPEAESPIENKVFCPNCGKCFTSGEQFCDVCGGNLSGEEVKSADQPNPGANSKANHRNKGSKKFIYMGVAAVAIVGALAGGSRIAGRFFKAGSTSQTEVVYFKDTSIYVTDLNSKENPEEVTDFYRKGFQGAFFGANQEVDITITKDQKYLFYIENYGEGQFDLCKAQMAKLQETEKIDSNVSEYRVLSDNTVLYIKNGSLYYNNGKEKLKFGKNVAQYKINKEENSIMWCENNQRPLEAPLYACYYQDLKQKKDKIKLEDDVSGYWSNGELSTFYLLKNNTLYKADSKGDNEKLAGKIMTILDLDPETGAFYYLKDGEKTEKVDFEQVVFDDGNTMEEGDWWKVKGVSHTMHMNRLCYFKDGEEIKISDRFLSGSAPHVSASEGYCYFAELPELENIHISWNDMETYGGTASLTRAADMSLALGGEKSESFDELKNIPWDTFYSKETGLLYIVEGTDYYYPSEEQDRTVYTVKTKGDTAGIPEQYDIDIARGLFATEKGLYYLRDYDDMNYSGDLYCQDEKIASDVAEAYKPIDSDYIFLSTNRDFENRSATIMLYDGKKARKIADDVVSMDYDGDGTALVLRDYDFNNWEGELLYYNGKDMKSISDDVSGFVRRRGCSSITY